MMTFDTPGLSTIQFLYSVMCDRRVPMMLRIKAANLLMQTGHGNMSFVQAIKGVIEDRVRKPPPTEEYVTQRLRSIHIATVNGMRVA